MHTERINQITEALFSQSASVVKRGILQYVSIEELLELSLHPTERIAFRAAWSLEHVLLTDDKQDLQRRINDIIGIYIASDNWSVLRSYSKLIMEILSHPESLRNLTEENTESILNTTFRILENSECPVAVRCNAYDILTYFIPQHEWIIQELKHRMELDLERNEMPALKSRAKKVLKRLERIAKT